MELRGIGRIHSNFSSAKLNEDTETIMIDIRLKDSATRSNSLTGRFYLIYMLESFDISSGSDQRSEGIKRQIFLPRFLKATLP